MHIRNLRGKVLFFPLGCIQNRPFKKVNFLKIKVPENLHTTSTVRSDVEERFAEERLA